MKRPDIVKEALRILRAGRDKNHESLDIVAKYILDLEGEQAALAALTGKLGEKVDEVEKTLEKVKTDIMRRISGILGEPT